MATEKKQHLPLLLTSHGERSEKQSIYNLSDNQYRTTSIPVLTNMSVLGSSFGWLVLVDQTEGDGEDDCCLWNPTSMEKIELPDLYDAKCYNRCILSKPPTDPNCLIVFNQTFCTDQKVYRVEDGVAFDVHSKETGYLILSMLSLKGVIYGLIQPLHEKGSVYEFVTFHVVGDTLEKTSLWEVPRLVPSWITWNINYLMESPCGNELLLVTQMLFTFSFGRDVCFRVFRVDFDNMECEELHNLGDRTIFISFCGNGFCRSSKSVRANSIYYVKTKVLHVYDMNDRSTIALQTAYSSSDIDLSSSEEPESSWVESNILTCF